MKKQKVLFLLVVTGVVLSGVVFSFFVRSKVSSINALRSSIENLSKQDDGRSDRKDGRSGNIENLRRLFPPTANTPAFIEDVYGIAKQRNLKNLTFEQKPAEFIEAGSGRVSKALPSPSQKGIYAHHFRIGFDAGYRNMAEFIREIGNLERFKTIESLLIRRNKESLAVEMVVTIYSTGQR